MLTRIKVIGNLAQGLGSIAPVFPSLTLSSLPALLNVQPWNGQVNEPLFPCLRRHSMAPRWADAMVGLRGRYALNERFWLSSWGWPTRKRPG